VEEFLTPLSLLMPAFSLPSAPQSLTRLLHSPGNAPLPLRKAKSVASAPDLSPVTLSAPDHLTSELLRTLSMVAASKPTSWLSRQSNIVSHLARN
jgi:hypothetical protein